MHTVEEYREILTLWGAGKNKKAIARTTGIPRPTVIQCIQRFHDLAGLEEALAEKARQGKGDAESVVAWLLDRPKEVHQAYTYLLGLYLGDGNISKPTAHRVYRLRIALDQKYPDIIQACVDALEVLLPDNRIGTVPADGCTHVSCYYNHWPALFPQHGEGPKHLRPIVLTEWQERFATTYPLELFRGLYHSDGSRSQNIVNGTNYPRYLFTNESPGIRTIFCQTCDRLGLHWTIANRRNVCVSRRRDVAFLDQVIGAKR